MLITSLTSHPYILKKCSNLSYRSIFLSYLLHHKKCHYSPNIPPPPSSSTSFISTFFHMLHYAMLCYAMLCYAMLCYAMLCYAMLCYAMLCYAMLCYAMLCHVKLHYTVLYYLKLCYTFTVDLSHQNSGTRTPAPPMHKISPLGIRIQLFRLFSPR